MAAKPKSPSARRRRKKRNAKATPTAGSLPGLLLSRLSATAHEWSHLSRHPGLMGSARERALAELLRGFLPRRVEVLDGAIAVGRNASEATAPEQVDVVVVDTWQFPTLLRVADHAVVVPESVVYVGEVKSKLTVPPTDGAPPGKDQTHERHRDLLAALRQVGRIFSTRTNELGGVRSFLFAFAGVSKAATLRSWLESVLTVRARAEVAAAPGDSPSVPGPDAILLARLVLPHIILVLNGRRARAVIALKQLTSDRPPGEYCYRFFERPAGEALLWLVLTVLESLSARFDRRPLAGVGETSASGLVPVGAGPAPERVDLVLRLPALMKVEWPPPIASEACDALPL